jgi:hypothetical protein
LFQPPGEAGPDTVCRLSPAGAEHLPQPVAFEVANLFALGGRIQQGRKIYMARAAGTGAGAVRGFPHATGHAAHFVRQEAARRNCAIAQSPQQHQRTQSTFCFALFGFVLRRRVWLHCGSFLCKNRSIGQYQTIGKTVKINQGAAIALNYCFR